MLSSVVLFYSPHLDNNGLIYIDETDYILFVKFILYSIYHSTNCSSSGAGSDGGYPFKHKVFEFNFDSVKFGLKKGFR